MNSRENAEEIKALKKRFKILNPNKIPSWVCIEAVAILEEEAQKWLDINDDGEFKYKDDVVFYEERQYERILELITGSSNLYQSLDMKKTWEKISSVFKEDPKKSQVWFSKCLVNSLPSPYANFMNPSDLDKYRQKIVKKLREVQELIERAPFNLINGWLEEHSEAKKIIDENKSINPNLYCPSLIINDGPITRCFNPEYEVAMLRDLLEKSTASYALTGKNTKGKTADRQFFISLLTLALLQQTGKPAREVVSSSTNAVFGCDLSTPEIIRATKDLDPAIEPSVLSDMDLYCLDHLKINKLLTTYPF